MLIGVCQVELLIPNSSSLKSKRFIIQSLKTRLRNKFNISVTEVGETDKWQRCLLGISMVTNEKKFIDKTMMQVLNFIDNYNEVEVINHKVEIL